MKMFAKSFAVIAAALAAVPAFAQEAATETVAAAAPALTDAVKVAVGSTVGWVGLSIGIMMGLAVLGGALGQSKAAATALDGIARNPAASGKFTVPLILSLALMESLVLFAFLISLFLQGSVSKALSILAQ